MQPSTRARRSSGRWRMRGPPVARGGGSGWIWKRAGPWWSARASGGRDDGRRCRWKVETMAKDEDAGTTAREAVYDERISPLMAQIIVICKKNKIPMVASFD